MAAASSAVELDYGTDDEGLFAAGSEAAYTLARSAIDARAFRIEADIAVSLSVQELSACTVDFVTGTVHLQIGRIAFALGAPAGVAVAGIALSILHARYPLFGGPVSERACRLLQALGPTSSSR